MKLKNYPSLILGIIMLFGFLSINSKNEQLINENNQLKGELSALESQLQTVKESVFLLESQPSSTESTFDMNDVKAGIYCCGWDFYNYDKEKDVTIITPTLVPISITVKGKIPDYIDFTQADRTHFTFFYKNGESYYPIMTYRVVSKAAIKYGWLSEKVIDPSIDLGNGYIVYVADPNVPSNEYTDDPDILQKMKDFMSLVSIKVVK